MHSGNQEVSIALVSILRHIRTRARTISLAVACLSIAPIWAQNQTPAVPSAGSSTAQTSQQPAHSSPHVTKHSVHARTAEAAPLPAVAELPPLPPPHPDWPVNDRAGVASVDWNGRNLVIAATNSSLEQILRDVSTATGVKVEGVTTDERIYGSYGPAPARDVLSQLLDGSGYNVMMVGDRGEGTPRELVLTTRTHVASQPASTNVEARQNNDDEAPEEPEPVEQSNPGVHRPFGIAPGQPGAGRNPEQIMQEMQERQQQIQSAQPQQQPQPVQPNSQPPNE